MSSAHSVPWRSPFSICLWIALGSSPSFFLENLLASLGVIFTKKFFVFSVKYSFARRDRCSLVNFVLGQAKLAIIKSQKNKILATGFINPISIFRILMVSRIMIEFAYFKMVHNLDSFERRWCIGEGVCAMSRRGSLFCSCEKHSLKD